MEDGQSSTDQQNYVDVFFMAPFKWDPCNAVTIGAQANLLSVMVPQPQGGLLRLSSYTHVLFQWRIKTSSQLFAALMISSCCMMNF